MRTVPEIVRDCGGFDAVASVTGLGADAVRKWAQSSIPERHWAELRKLTEISVEELHAANEATRNAKAA